MAQKYYEDNLISRFIKCLTWDTYLPIVDVWRPGKSLIAGLTYITNDKYIVVAKENFDINTYQKALDDASKYVKLADCRLVTKKITLTVSDMRQRLSSWHPNILVPEESTNQLDKIISIKFIDKQNEQTHILEYNGSGRYRYSIRRDLYSYPIHSICIIYLSDNLAEEIMACEENIVEIDYKVILNIPQPLPLTIDETQKKYIKVTDEQNNVINLMSDQVISYNLIGYMWVKQISVPNVITPPTSGIDSNYFDVIEPFVENKFYRGVTTNLQTNSALYDSETHYALGQYLRYLRDMYEIDLMPFYNCFSGNSSDTIRIQENNGVEHIEENNKVKDDLITYIVPIKFNTPYTIYYDTMTPFKVRPVYYNGIKVQPIRNADNNTEITSTLVRGCSKNKPFVFKPLSYYVGYSTSWVNYKLLEDYLTLLIQVPKEANSNIVVLEGDYSDVKLIRTGTGRHLQNKYVGDLSHFSQKDINQVLKPYSSLLENNTDINYAFCDRLIEYLLYAPIINRDRVKDNIFRIQKYLSSNSAIKALGKKYLPNYVRDVWDNNLRFYIYDLVTSHKEDDTNYTPMKSNIPRVIFDINGFVDKDSEYIIDRAKYSIYSSDKSKGDNLNV